MTQDDFNMHILSRLDRLDSKLDDSINRSEDRFAKTMYVLIGIGGGVLVSLITGIVSILISLL